MSTLLIEDPRWRTHRGLQARLKNAAEAARKAVKLKDGFTILLAGDKRQPDAARLGTPFRLRRGLVASTALDGNVCYNERDVLPGDRRLRMRP